MMIPCIPPQGGSATGEEVQVTDPVTYLYCGTALVGTATPNPGWTFDHWEWNCDSWYDHTGTHTYSVKASRENPSPASVLGCATYRVPGHNGAFVGYYHQSSYNLRAIFRNTGGDGGGSSGGSAKYYAAVNLSVRGEAARNAGCKVSVSGEPFALDSQSCVVLGSPGEVAFTLAYKESAQFKFSEYQDENGSTVISPVVLTASTSGSIANIYALFEGDGRQILHGASNTILHGRNGTILHLE